MEHRAAARRARSLAALCACAALAACSLLAPKFEKPTLSIESIALEHGDLMTQHLTVRMRVENPNKRALPVKELSYTLYIEGEQAAEGVSDRSFTVPALGEAEFDMHITANMAATLLRLLARGGSARDAIEYRVAGKVELSSGFMRSLPFERHGTFSLR